jgi:hypothetical protein
VVDDVAGKFVQCSHRPPWVLRYPSKV